MCCIGKWNPNEYQMIDILKAAILGLEVAILVRHPLLLLFFICTVVRRFINLSCLVLRL